MKKTIVSLMVMVALLFTAPAQAGVHSVNADLKCLSVTQVSHMHGAAKAAKCRVHRQTFEVLRYTDISQGVNYWLNATDGGSFARKYHTLVIPLGNAGKSGDWGLLPHWARYAAQAIGGRTYGA